MFNGRATVQDQSALGDQIANTEPAQPIELQGLTVQRAAEDPAANEPTAAPQPAAAADPPPSSAAADGPSPTSATSATSDQSGSTNLDELARRLFDPLTNRLKAELWLDRERAGLITDARP